MQREKTSVWFCFAINKCSNLWNYKMYDIENLIKNIETVYESNTAFQVLKDYERVLDTLDLYVYENWKNGELLEGPKIDRHWVTAKFMWPRENMPDPMGGKRLVDYDCKVSYAKDDVIQPRRIKTPDDIRPGTKKGKLDKKPIWVVEIQMPKKLIADIYEGYRESLDINQEPAVDATDTATAPGVEAQPADQVAAEVPAEGTV